MDPRQLKKWKEKELEKTKEFFNKKKIIFAVNDVYPEFKFEKPYTTSLDGYLPIGILLPFFKRINVGIFPYLKNEEEFFNWYGLYPKDLLWLYEKERINLRILFPHALNSIPKYLNIFFNLNLPTTLRDLYFTKFVLGSEKLSFLESRFNSLFNIKNDKSIDNFKGNKKRAILTAKNVFLQLHSFNYINEAESFESLAKVNLEEALTWLELCRLFKIGPRHYSMGGTHSVATNIINDNFLPEYKKTKFPFELGRIILETFKLVDTETKIPQFNIKQAIEYKFYENSELAHNLLYGLAELVENGKINIDDVEDLKKLFNKTTKTEKIINRAFNLIAGVGISVATAPLGTLGLLAGLGFTGVTSLFPQISSSISDKILENYLKLNDKSSLILLINKDLKKLYKY